MKTKIFLLTFMLSSLLLISISLAGISCDPCTVGNCKCTITDFSSGTFGAYPASDCSGFPPDYAAFSDGAITWAPNQTGTYYLRACFDADCTNCTSQQVSGGTTTTTVNTTTTTQAGCRREGHVCNQTSPCCAGLNCTITIGTEGFCKNITTTTTKQITTTTQPTTTTAGKKTCPFDCCIDEEQYYDKACPQNYDCVQKECVPVKTGSRFYYYIVIVVFIVIVIAIILFFIFGKGGEKESEWGRLYRKYGRR